MSDDVSSSNECRSCISRSISFVLAEREAELLNLKGPCRAPQCRLHHSHRGPCDTRRPE